MKFAKDNYYLQFGSNFFQQVIDVPMGSDSNPFEGSAFLSYYKDKSTQKTKQRPN